MKLVDPVLGMTALHALLVCAPHRQDYHVTILKLLSLKSLYQVPTESVDSSAKVNQGI